jgi:TonB-linked SusC/RagA family outer membrane protein
MNRFFNIKYLKCLSPYSLKKICAVSFTALLLPVCAFSQEIRITGNVFDNTGPLAGVAIRIKGTTQGVVGNDNGEFSIAVRSETDTLQFILAGYQTEEAGIGQRRVLSILMKEETTELDEVMIVAFGTQKKESVIASITTVNPADLKVPSSNLTTALAGRMAGLIAYQRSGEPGRDNAEFFIRGVTTFGYKKDPLILIDNNESTSQELARMQPDDIANFTILKDATATALYGARGANGVIMVATKEGREGKAKIDIRYEEALSMPTQMVKLADPITYMYQHNEAIKTRDPLAPSRYPDYVIQNTAAGVNPYVYPMTDWYKTLFKDYTNNHRLNFSATGGGGVAQYYLAGSVINDNGMLNVDKLNNFNNNVDLNRYMLRTNVNINITKTTRAVVRISGSFDDYSGPIDGGDAIFEKVMHTNPVLFPPYYAPDKKYRYSKHILFGNAGGTGGYNNPYADMVKGYKQYSTALMSAQFELKQKLDFITQGLSARAMFNTTRYSYFDYVRQFKPYYYRVTDYDKKTDTYMLDEVTRGDETLGYTEGEKDVSATTYFESSLNWNRTFKEKHETGALLVFAMRNELKGNASDLQKSLPYRNMNLAGRITYAYDSRYLFEGNFGYNGSERFAQKERFGFFPSAGLGWIVSNEKFYGDGLKSVLNNLKLKATYGLVGNDAIGTDDERFFYLSRVSMRSGQRRAGFGTFGSSSMNGTIIDRYANEDITWETSQKMNLTAEIGLFKKIDLQVEYFDEHRYNILMERANIPTTMGLTAPLKANVGESTGRGMDISLNVNHSFNADTWITAMGNFTYATSEFLVYEEPKYPGAPWKTNVGYSLGQLRGYIAERLFVDEEEINNSPEQFRPYMAGDIKYKDLNGDGKISELDIAPIGYPETPEIVYGFGASAGWKQFDLSFFFQGLARESFYIDATKTSPFTSEQYALIQAYADSHWSEENRDLYALWPRLSPNPVENNTHGSTWWLRNGSFLRLKSLEVGYTLPAKVASKIYLANLRIYFSGTNLLTFSKFKLWDPEMGGNGLGYPVQKVYNLGLQLSF